MRQLRAAIGTMVMWALPSFALAATGMTLSGLANQIVGFLNKATLTLITLAIVIYFWGIVSNLYRTQEGGARSATALRGYVLLGLGVIFVMVSIWGILRLLQNTLFPSSSMGTSSHVAFEGYSLDV